MTQPPTPDHGKASPELTGSAATSPTRGRRGPVARLSTRRKDGSRHGVETLRPSEERPEEHPSTSVSFSLVSVNKRKRMCAVGGRGGTACTTAEVLHESGELVRCYTIRPLRVFSLNQLKDPHTHSCFRLYCVVCESTCYPAPRSVPPPSERVLGAVYVHETVCRRFW